MSCLLCAVKDGHSCLSSCLSSRARAPPNRQVRGGVVITNKLGPRTTEAFAAAAKAGSGLEALRLSGCESIGGVACTALVSALQYASKLRALHLDEEPLLGGKLGGHIDRFTEGEGGSRANY
mgnify:CR=1 FL=1